MRATYAGLITEIDDCLGRVFAWLDENGQWEETMIVFTSDHGEQLGDHWLLGKIGYFDESFRIPFVVKDAGRSPRAGAIEDAFTESVDVMPTILDALGGTVPAPATAAPSCRCSMARGLRTGATRCSTNTTSATSIIRSRRASSASAWMTARSASSRTSGTNTSISPRCRRSSSTWRATPTSSSTWPRTRRMPRW
jgi:hypothetical protein